VSSLSPAAISELRATLADMEPSARFVSPRILRRIIRKHRHIGGFGREVAHEHCYAIGRAVLETLVDPEDVGGPVSGDPALLLVEPDSWDLETGEEEAWVAFWQRLYEVRVFAACQQRREAGTLPLGAVRERIHRIGQTEADEIRATLRKELLLLPPLPGEARDEITWSCFAATWASLSAFDPDELLRFFPTLGARRPEIDALLERDLATARLLESSRPPSAPELEKARALREPKREPASALARFAPLGAGAARALLLRAEAARAKGNHVRAAILSQRAAHADDGAAERAQADADLSALGTRLEAMLGRNGAGSWPPALRPVLERVSGILAPEGRLLYDLQKACVDHEREVHRIDLVEWALSLGRRPIRRALPSLREVRVARHLRSALHRLAAVRLAEADAHRLRELLEGAVEAREERVRAALRPVIAQALRAATPEATTHVERIARDKAVEELLDRLVEKGRIDFPLVRDAIARNQAKLADMKGPADLVRDNLLRIDRDLAAPLEGVYRRAEIYRRFLQRFSALGFGTSVGRWVTRLLLLPAAGSYIALEGLQHTVGLLIEKLAKVEVHLVSLPALIGVGVLILALVNSATVRAGTLSVFRALGRALRSVFIAFPAWILARPWMKALLQSAAWRSLSAWMFKPATVVGLTAGVLWKIDVSPETRWSITVALYVLTAAFLNSPLGRQFGEAFTDALIRSRRWLANRFFPALVRWILVVFRTLVEGLERALYAVDEFLRFRPGDRRAAIAAKTILGLPWGALTYVLRFYVNVLLEPKYNPVKHFPVVTVGHKIILPISLNLIDSLSQPLMPLGATAAKTIAGTTVFLLPGLFGFLAWELKENWRLYRRNRAANLRPVIVGSHGENVLRLLRPGFHSGTVPKIFAKLRRAARRPPGANRERALHKQEEALHHARTEVHRFAERELASLVNPLCAPAAWRVSAIELGSNRIQVRLEEQRSGKGVTVSLEEQSGWIVAGVAAGDAAMTPELRAALRGFYHLAGVDLAREEIVALLPGAPPYDIADEGLVVWPGAGYETEVVYPLEDRLMLEPRMTSPGPAATALLPLRRVDLFFKERALPWAEWVQTWESWAGAKEPRLTAHAGE
jgi:hypothetical protein